MSERRKVVVIGGGGLSAAQDLNSNLVDVTLIDWRNYHLFQPLLYQDGLSFARRDRLPASQRAEPPEKYSRLTGNRRGCGS
jgi:NADH dehydrogenase FAD-containing subunit